MGSLVPQCPLFVPHICGMSSLSKVSRCQHFKPSFYHFVIYVICVIHVISGHFYSLSVTIISKGRAISNRSFDSSPFYLSVISPLLPPVALRLLLQCRCLHRQSVSKERNNKEGAAFCTKNQGYREGTVDGGSQRGWEVWTDDRIPRPTQASGFFSLFFPCPLPPPFHYCILCFSRSRQCVCLESSEGSRPATGGLPTDAGGLTDVCDAASILCCSTRWQLLVAVAFFPFQPQTHLTDNDVFF